MQKNQNTKTGLSTLKYQGEVCIAWKFHGIPGSEIPLYSLYSLYSLLGNSTVHSEIPWLGNSTVFLARKFHGIPGSEIPRYSWLGNSRLAGLLSRAESIGCVYMIANHWQVMEQLIK